MKSLRRGLMAATLGLLGSLSIAAHASTVLNIPFSAGTATPVAGGDPCINANIGYAPSTISQCTVDVPIPVPAGHTIQQIAVIHDTSWGGNGPPTIDARLQTQSSSPFVHFDKFFWVSQSLASFGTVNLLMNEIVINGSHVYFDQFSTQPDTLYHVTVTLQGSAVFEGLRVTYL